MCTCVKILLADVANMNTNNIMIRAKKTDIEFNNIKDWIIPCEGTHAQGTGGSIRTSRHSALLEVTDHS